MLNIKIRYFENAGNTTSIFFKKKNIFFLGSRGLMDRESDL